MITKGKARGNGKQLAKYLTTKADNDNIRLLSIRKTCHPEDLVKSLLEMSLTCELTKSQKGLYHAQICPAHGEDKAMSDEDWERAADILEQELRFTGQKRAIVLHDKKQKIHAHVVWERYDHETGIMKSDQFSGYAHARAREIMEREFGHQRTPERNERQPEMKQYLTRIWQQTNDADSFIKAIAEKGYVIAVGTDKPYKVIDETGRCWNLVRALEGVNTKAVRERFKSTRLVREKDGIEQARKLKKEKLKPRVRVRADDMQKAQQRASNENTNRKQQEKTKALSMEASFTIDNQVQQKAMDKLQEIVQQMDEKEKKKREMIERVKKARQFRENERDL